jgi:osmoprotectant transport system ATP-binding protein
MLKNQPISLQNATVRYGQDEVLSNINLSFSMNCVTALLGKSGSGKSTLLQLLNGMIQPSAGKIRLWGHDFDYKNANQLRLNIGYAVQQVGLFPHLNLYDNISLLGKITKMAPQNIQKRVIFLLNMVQLPQLYFGKYPYELSGGEAQRVGLCRALFLKPSILLMDEPFAALDSDTKNNIYQYFLLLQRTEPCTVVLVTHDLNEAEILADELILLDKGQIVSQRKIVK